MGTMKHFRVLQTDYLNRCQRQENGFEHLNIPKLRSLSFHFTVFKLFFIFLVFNLSTNKGFSSSVHRLMVIFKWIKFGLQVRRFKFITDYFLYSLFNYFSFSIFENGFSFGCHCSIDLLVRCSS